MNAYETPEGVDEYIKMCEGYDHSQIKTVMMKYLAKGMSVLEIGVGPGNDYNWMRNYYNVTGSDYSDEFLKRIKIRFPDGDFIKLDALSFNTKRKFDCIFSNKVYQHFTLDQIEDSLSKQSKVLKPGGLIYHTFWIGDKEFDVDEMHFYYHDTKKLISIIKKQFNVLESRLYNEFEENDSVIIVAERKY